MKEYKPDFCKLLKPHDRHRLRFGNTPIECPGRQSHGLDAWADLDLEMEVSDAES